MEIMAAHRIPYAATACVGAPEDLAGKSERAKAIKGTRFTQLFASCPNGWWHAPELSLEVARQAIKSRVFPLYEVFDGDIWKISPMPKKEAVDAYLKYQGRFKKMSVSEYQHFQKQVDDDWEILLHKCVPV